MVDIGEILRTILNVLERKLSKVIRELSYLDIGPLKLHLQFPLRGLLLCFCWVKKVKEHDR